MKLLKEFPASPLCFWIGVLLLLSGNFLPARAQGLPRLDASFRPVITRAGGFVSAVAAQPDGKLVIAGNFNAIGGIARNGIARLHPDGSPDLEFAAGAGVNCGPVLGEFTAPGTLLLIQRDGRVVLIGAFSSVHGEPRRGIARLNADGSLDASFNPRIDLALEFTLIAPAAGVARITALVEQPDGKLLIGGLFNRVNGVRRQSVARLNPDGSLDAGFDPGSGAEMNSGTGVSAGRVDALALLPGGRILLGGLFSAFNGAPRSGLARLNPDGSLDPAFHLAITSRDGIAAIDGLAAQPGGKAVFSGAFETVEDNPAVNLAGLDPSGVPDPAFAAPAANRAKGEFCRVLAAGPDGGWIVFRGSVGGTGVLRNELARLAENGALDASFTLPLRRGPDHWYVWRSENDDGLGELLGLARQPDGKWVAAGKFIAGPDGVHAGIVRLNAEGGIDETFRLKLEISDELGGTVNTLAAQEDGKILIGGVFNRVNGTERNLLARLNRDGSLDETFASVIDDGIASGFISAIVPQPDGRILISGVFRGVGGEERSGIARLLANGALDRSFDPGEGTNEKTVTGRDAAGRVSAIALRPDGKILAGGNFAAMHGRPATGLALLNADGTVEAGFAPVLTTCSNCPPPEVWRIIVTRDGGGVWILGTFQSVNGVPVPGLARLLAAGRPDPAFSLPVPSAEEVVDVVAFPDDWMVALTRDLSSGSLRDERLRYFAADGTPGKVLKVSAANRVIFETLPKDYISAIAADASERLILGGTFSRVGEAPRAGLARITADGNLDSGFASAARFGLGLLLPPSRVRMVTGIVAQEDGGIVVGGAFSLVNGEVRTGLARFQADAPVPRLASGDGTIRFPGRSGDGSFLFSITGTTGQVYRVEASDDFRTWLDLGPVTLSSAVERFRDSGAGKHRGRIYRLRRE